MSEIKTLFIKDLTLDPKYQARSHMNPNVVKEYEEHLIAGVTFPPITVVKTPDQHIVVDGFHRVEAHVNLGRDRIAADVIDGDHWTALELAVAANQTHGLQRSREDKTRAVEMALIDFVVSGKSDRELGKLCGVSHTFVASVRNKFGQTRLPNKFSRKVAKFSHPEVESTPPQVDQFEEAVDQRTELIELLIKENEDLNSRVAVACMDGSPEEKEMALKTIDDLREQLRIANIELEAIKTSRDSYQNENAQFKRQCQSYQKQIKRMNDHRGKSAQQEEEPLPF